MRRLLIAAAGELGKCVEKQLRSFYDITICQKGELLSQQLCSLDPDILLLDMSLPGTDTFAILESIAATGRQTAAIVLLTVTSDYILARLANLGIKCVLTKPCHINYVVSHIRQIDFMQQNPDLFTWSVEGQTENMLMDLGFSVSKGGYFTLCRAIAYKYENRESQMKQVYYAVADAQGTSFSQVEKAVRDVILDAYNNGDPYLWRMYFQPRKKAKSPCPTSEEFVARIVECLRHRTRMKAPYLDKAE